MKMKMKMMVFFVNRFLLSTLLMTIISSASSSSTPHPPSPPSSAFVLATVLSSVNAYRKIYGVPPVVLNGTLTAGAQAWASDLSKAKTLAHSALAGVAYGENLAEQVK